MYVEPLLHELCNDVLHLFLTGAFFHDNNHDRPSSPDLLHPRRALQTPGLVDDPFEQPGDRVCLEWAVVV